MSVRPFYRLSLSTLIAVYLLILVGGVVRSTGSGMGCPDWPKCFGQWVPPTSVEQLPDNYKDIYSNHRHEKNVRFVKYLNALGLESTANKILTDESIRQEADFNPVKTWIEYVNRLIGVVIGLLILSVFVRSLRFWNTNRRWTVVAFLTFVLVGFQGWIGSIVVSTNLTPWTITFHMFLALIIVGMLVYLVHQSGTSSVADAIQVTAALPWMIGCLGVLIIQILFGTQVREAMDRVATSLTDRTEWVSALGAPFVIHRSFSWVVVILHAGLIYKLFRNTGSNRFALGLILLILGTILTGAGMAWFSVPPVLQPLHLLLASVTFGTLFLLMLKLKRRPKEVLS